MHGQGFLVDASRRLGDAIIKRVSYREPDYATIFFVAHPTLQDSLLDCSKVTNEQSELSEQISVYTAMRNA